MGLSGVIQGIREQIDIGGIAKDLAVDAASSGAQIAIGAALAVITKNPMAAVGGARLEICVCKMVWGLAGSGILQRIPLILRISGLLSKHSKLGREIEKWAEEQRAAELAASLEQQKSNATFESLPEESEMSNEKAKQLLDGTPEGSFILRQSSDKSALVALWQDMHGGIQATTFRRTPEGLFLNASGTGVLGTIDQVITDWECIRGKRLIVDSGHLQGGAAQQTAPASPSDDSAAPSTASAAETPPTNPAVPEHNVEATDNKIAAFIRNIFASAPMFLLQTAMIANGANNLAAATYSISMTFKAAFLFHGGVSLAVIAATFLVKEVWSQFQASRNPAPAAAT